jgi:L-threonylcarbamoyladenylate synthase
MTTHAPILDTSGQFIEQTLDVLACGGLIISPSVTNYILICDATNQKAVERIFEVKQRSQTGPLCISAPSASHIGMYVELPTGFSHEALEALFPGEINMIFNRKYPFPSALTCGLSTLAVNVSSDRDFGLIASRYGKPLAGTSANISGQGNIFVSLDKAIADIGAKVDLILDGGPTVAQAYENHIHRVNTIIDFTLGEPWLVREGWVPISRILEFFPNLNTDVEGYRRQFRERIQKAIPCESAQENR